MQATQQQQQIPAEVPALNTLPLVKGDWGKLREAYGARKGGCWRYDQFLHGEFPGFKLAAQIDLDRFHGGEEHVLDWYALFDVEPPKVTPHFGGQPDEVRRALHQVGQGSLSQMAAGIVGGAAKAAPKPERPTFTDAELSAVKSALSITICETDGTPTDHALYERIDAYLKAVA